MLFNIEADTGEEIVGYLVPNGYLEVPSLCLIDEGRVLWSGEANESRDALVRSGRHATGRCGFRIGKREVPRLAEVAAAEIRDLGTGLTLYRRPGRMAIERKLFRIETRLLGLQKLDRMMEPIFGGWFPGVDRFGIETVAQIFNLPAFRSVYASGRIWPATHPELLAGDFAVVVALRDPYLELAERLMLLSNTAAHRAQQVPDRDRSALEPAAEAFKGVPLDSGRAVRRAFRRLSWSAGSALSNPTTRQLSLPGPGADPAQGGVASALRLMSGFAHVAIEQSDGYFEAGLSEILEGTPIPPAIPAPDMRLMELADLLADIPTVETILEADLDLYAHVSAVFDRLSQPAAPDIAEANMRW